jgi:hypothetical protein
MEIEEWLRKTKTCILNGQAEEPLQTDMSRAPAYPPNASPERLAPPLG